MKIKTQFIMSMVIFSIVLLIVASSVIITNQQISQLNQKQEISANVEKDAEELNNISSQYFLYQQPQLLTFWQSNITSISSNLTNLNSTNVDQQTLVNKARDDLVQLNTSFATLVSYLALAPRNVSVRVISEFQNYWNQTVSEHQALGLDASRLSESLRTQIDQLRQTNIGLIIALLGVFGAFLLTIYLITYRRTLKSISSLQAGINVIGSGNLDYSIQTKKEDEISELSQSFNKMTANLKTVTASKADLEQEIDSRKKAEIALRQSEQRWATTLSSIGDAVIATDLLGRIIFMNGVAEELTGWAFSEASLKPIKEVFNIVNEQTRVEVENPVSKVLEKGLIVGLANHTVVVRKNKTEVPIDDSGAPIKDKDGNTIGVVLIFRDISERKKTEEALRENEQRLRFHAENIPLAVVEWDRNFVVTRWAGDAEKMFGWSASETVGNPIMDLHLIYDPDIPIVEKTMVRLTSGETKVVSSNQNITKEGNVIYCTWYNSVLLDEKGKMVSVFSFVQDNTARVNAENSLEKNNQNLEKLVEERTRQLKDSERLAAIGATAGMVGHDIRNPLQAITGDVYLIKTELASIPEGEERKNALENLTEIEKNIDYINKIVADLQDFARPLKPHVEETDLKLIIKDLISKNGLPQNVKVSVKVETAARKVVADSAYINRIMYNLVNNGVQAMPEGGNLTIHIYRKENDVVLAVKDTGVGIPESVRSKLFTPMFTTKSKGQGFGLAVVKRMTEALGGTVTFESQEGKGTTFIVRLPLPKGKQ
jgi:PAS domain S-box-containing protein